MNSEEHPEYSVQILPNKEEGQTYKSVSDKLLEVARKFIKENEWLYKSILMTGLK